MLATNQTTNAYWDAVRDHVEMDNVFGAAVPVVDAYGSIRRDYSLRVSRDDLTSRYSWTVTDPDTVAFVRANAGPMVVDPLAGSGWWAHLLTEAGATVLASDLNPPNRSDANHWHRHDTHVPVLALDAVEAVEKAPAEATLLLSWPPYDSDIGAQVLRAFRGGRVIYIDEAWGGRCGDDAMFELFNAEWDEVAEHRPIQYYGIRDRVTVYERKVNQ